MSQIARSSLVVTIFTAIGIGFSVLSNVVIASKFGAGKDMDVFLASTTIPLFIIGILSGSLGFVFIPILEEYSKKDSSEFRKVVNDFLNLNILVTSSVCILGIMFAYSIIKTTVPGFSEEKVKQATIMLRWLFPTIIFAAISESLASVYYFHQRFVIPTVNKLISPIIIMVFVLLCHSFLSTFSIVLAILVASFVQTTLLVFGFFRTHNFNYYFVIDFKHPSIIKIVKLLTPVISGIVICGAIPIVDRYFLSKLQEGSIAHIGYAMNLLNVIPIVTASGISITIFPLMSKYAANGDLRALKEVIINASRMLFFLIIPILVLLWIYGRSIIKLIFERGMFFSVDTNIVYHIFGIYLLSLPAGIIGLVISRGFYATQQNNTITIITIMMMVLYVALCSFFIRHLGYFAIPIAYAVYHNCAIFTTTITLSKKIGKISWGAITPLIFKSMIAIAIVLLMIYPISRLETEGIFFVPGLCAIGFIIYFLVAKFILNIREANLIWQIIVPRFIKRPIQ